MAMGVKLLAMSELACEREKKRGVATARGSVAFSAETRRLFELVQRDKQPGGASNRLSSAGVSNLQDYGLRSKRSHSARVIWL